MQKCLLTKSCTANESTDDCTKQVLLIKCKFAAIKSQLVCYSIQNKPIYPRNASKSHETGQTTVDG